MFDTGSNLTQALIFNKKIARTKYHFILAINPNLKLSFTVFS